MGVLLPFVTGQSIPLLAHAHTHTISGTKLQPFAAVGQNLFHDHEDLQFEEEDPYMPSSTLTNAVTD